MNDLMKGILQGGSRLKKVDRTAGNNEDKKEGQSMFGMSCWNGNKY